MLDKPLGLTSTQAGARVRRLFGADKAGHAGTLDPLATGVLPIAFGEATKTMPFAMDRSKVYRFTARWGESRTTDDREGEIEARTDVRPRPADIAAVLSRFVGRIEQVPPAFSAIKIDGQRAHALARAGTAPELKSRQVVIHRLELLSVPDPDHAEFEMECGTGTYVRSLVRDMAAALGTLGHVSVLRRTQVGPFRESDAISLERLQDLRHSPALDERLMPVETPLDDIPAVAVTGFDAARLRRGQPILVRGSLPLGDGPVCVMADDGPVALARVVHGEIRPTRVFNLPQRGNTDVDYA